MDLDDDLFEDFQGTLELAKEDKTILQENQKPKEDIFVVGPEYERKKNDFTSKLNLFSKQNKESLWSAVTREEEQSTAAIKPVSPEVSGNPTDFFTFRESVVEHAINECMEQLLDIRSDGSFISAYLLTEVSLWNTDKERLVLLSTNSVTIVKYDFIALKRLECRKVPLNTVDTIIVGDLTYPPASLVPQLQGLFDGFTNIVQKVFFDQCSKPKIFDIFQYRKRSCKGIRLMWNKDKPVNFICKWNPLSTQVPFVTLTSHPLLHYKECDSEIRKRMYDVEIFIEEICTAIKYLQQREDEVGLNCTIDHKDILLENYIGLGSLIHNRNNLGFFKVRGKLSF